MCMGVIGEEHWFREMFAIIPWTMKTYFADIIPKIQRFSQALDNLTLLTNQHWVLIDNVDENKNVYIFRPNNELLIARNGKVEKAKWEHLGHSSILIDLSSGSYLFRHGFFDENVLALKVDSRNEYAFFVNENKYSGEFSSPENIIEFLSKLYLGPGLINSLNTGQSKMPRIPTTKDEIHSVKEGELIVRFEYESENKRTMKVFLNGKTAPDGKYKLDFLWYVLVKDGLGEFTSSPFEG